MSKLTRRLALGSAGIAVGALAGLAGGVALAEPARAPAAITLDGRRRFEGKVVLVTGATSGIGRAAAEAYAAEGGKVAFCGRREELGREVEAGIKSAGGEALYIRADVRKEEDVKAFVDQAVSTFGGLDVAFNNAGVTLQKPLHEYSAAEFDDVVGTNLRGVFFSLKYEVPHMMAKGGSILITSSAVAVTSRKEQAAYTSSKAGVIGLMRSAALDYGQYGITVNSLSPGPVNTEFARRVAGMMNVPDDAWQVAAKQWAGSNLPSGRMATAQEMAAIALDLTCGSNPYMNGATILVDGAATIEA